MPVRHHDTEVGVERADFVHEDVAAGTVGLADRNAGVEGGDLDGRRDERGSGTAAGPIGLGHHGGDIDAAVEERAQTRNGELRRSEEDDTHQPPAFDSSGCGTRVRASPR